MPTKNNRLYSFYQAVLWSYRMAWETSPQLISVIIVCFAIEAVIPVASTGTLGVLVNRFKETGVQETTPLTSLLLWLGLLIGLLALEFIAGETRNFSRLSLADEAGVKLQKRLYQHSAAMDLSFFEESETLNRLFRATAGGGNTALGPIQSVLAGAAAGFQIISLLGLMFYLSPGMAFLLLAAGIPLLVVRSLSSLDRYRFDIRTTQRKRLSRYYTSKMTGTENVLAIKIFGLADEIISRFEKTALSIVAERKKLLKKISLRLIAAMFFYLLFIMAVIGWLTFSFSRGHFAAGSLVAFSLAAFRNLRSKSQLSQAIASGTESALAMLPLIDFLATKPSLSSHGSLKPQNMSGRIELKNVTFSYPHNATPVIDNLSLVIEAGQKIAIIGRNGAGKSTLIKLIARLYEPNSGKIEIDGYELCNISLPWLHKHISMVQQIPATFEANVFDNIAFGDWENLRKQHKKIIRIAQHTGLINFVDKLPNGFATHLGRLFGEVTLSTGQWQLLAITRALARENALLLLDEPTANLDAAAEAKVFETISRVATRQTVLLVSHRLSSIRQADRIIVLDKGKIAEDGNHDTLSRQKGYYSSIIKSQETKRNHCEK